MMNSNDIKRVISKIEPDAGLKNRLSNKVSQANPRRFSLKPVGLVAAGLVVVIGVAALSGTFNKGNQENPPGIVEQSSGITLPRIDLPTDGQVTAKMRPLIVYQGRIYVDSALSIDSNQAANLLGEKLGTTKASLTEWSTQDDYAGEFASTVGEQDVYSVKGYDKGFRIMTYQVTDSGAYAMVFECLNGITVKSGKDVFDKFKLTDPKASVKYEGLESWNNGLQDIKPLTDEAGLSKFFEALNASVPKAADSLPNIWDEQQKFLYVTMADGTSVQLRLFESGHVSIGSVDLYFQVDKTEFDQFWAGLK